MVSDSEVKPEDRKYIPVDELFSLAKKEGLLIALASKYQVQKGKSNKSPSFDHENSPKKYRGFNDALYGTAIRCRYVKKLNLHLVVIDLDIPKDDNSIPIDVLEFQTEPILKQTYCVRTPSGGIHIYLLNPKQPKLKQPPLNIDYQVTRRNNKGKYVVADYRWDNEGKTKEYYCKLPQSPDKIAVVDTDGVLNDILEGLTNQGYILTPAQELKINIISLLTKYYREGTRDEYSLAITGYLRKQGYKKDTVKEIINNVFVKDEELDKRIKNVDQTYEKDYKDIMGYSWLKTNIAPVDLETLTDLTRKDKGSYKLEKRIIQDLSKPKEPSVKLLADFINSELDLYKNLKTMNYYERTETGEFREINEKKIIEFCNEKFGVNSISSRQCYSVLKFVTRPIKKNYNLIEFYNGILDTRTKEFTKTKIDNNETPKISLNLDWNPEAKPGKIGEIIESILKNKNHPNNKERWMRAVGHAFMANNRLGKHTIVVGQPGSGKSTLNTILMRIFNYSNLPISTINANERFTLHALIDKDINIDDDINNGILKNIGTLNTITTGNGLEVEIKGENKTIKAGNQQIPRLFSSGNTLPPVFGEGYERRLLLIHADNKINYDDRDDMLQSDILLGEYDKNGVEWFIYIAITTYWEKMDQPITTEEDEAKMKEQYDFKSYPLKKGIEAIFREDHSGLEYISVREVNMWVKAWCRWAYKEEKISREHKKPSQHQIKNAMNHAGYDQNRIREGDIYTRVYEDIILNEDWNFILKPFKK